MEKLVPIDFWQILDDLCQDDVVKDFKNIIKAQSREKMEAILEEYEREIPFDLDPHERGLRFAEKLISEAEALRANLADLLKWGQERRAS